MEAIGEPVVGAVEVDDDRREWPIVDAAYGFGVFDDDL